MSGKVAECLQQLASLRDRLDGDIGQLFGRHGDTGADQDQQLCGKIGRKMLSEIYFVKLF